MAEPHLVRFGSEVVDLASRTEPVAHAAFLSLMDEDPSRPFFAFARVHSRSAASGDSDADGDEGGGHGGSGTPYRHLYSAETIIDWYPLRGTTDPCTRGAIERIEYFLHFRGEAEAANLGDVVPDDFRDTDDPVSRSVDYLIWHISGEDEPSRLMALLAVAYLRILGLPRLSSDDLFDTSDVALLDGRAGRDPDRRRRDRADGRRLLRYVRDRLDALAETGELECSDSAALLTSMERDAAAHLAGALASQDPDVDDGSDDFARVTHVRTNALAAGILRFCNGDLLAGAGSTRRRRSHP